MAGQKGFTSPDAQTQVLIVDDEKVIQMLLQTVLEQDGHAVHIAATAAAGVQAAAQIGDIDVALVDKNLPDRTGLEVIRDIRAHQPDCEVIIITGYASLDSAIEALQIGAFDYVLKPFDDVNDLRVKVRAAIERRRSADRYERLLAALPDAVVVYDADTGEVHDANPAAHRLYGYASGEMIGLSAEQITGGLEQGARRVRRTDRRKDGSEVEVNVSAASTRIGKRNVTIEVVREKME